jgi:tetratricopeptide (TPR) repeat protein
VFARDQKIFESLVEKEPANLAHQRELYLACYWAGRAARQAGKRDEAITRLKRAKVLAQALVDRGWSGAGTHEDLQVIEQELRLARRGRGMRRPRPRKRPGP